jgi:hypothetical protein
MSYIALATTTLGSSASTVTFSSIPTSVGGVALRDLILVYNGTGNATAPINLQLNGSGSGSSLYMQGDGSSPGSAVDANNLRTGFCISGLNSVIVAQIMDYSATDKHKTYLSREGMGAGQVVTWAGRRASNDAVTSVAFACVGFSFNSGSTFSLFGIAG